MILFRVLIVFFNSLFSSLAYSSSLCIPNSFSITYDCCSIFFFLVSISIFDYLAFSDFYCSFSSIFLVSFLIFSLISLISIYYVLFSDLSVETSLWIPFYSFFWERIASVIPWSISFYSFVIFLFLLFPSTALWTISRIDCAFQPTDFATRHARSKSTCFS